MTAIAYPRRFYSLVKFEHTVFALPFAYVGAFLAVDGVPSAHDLLWITVAMVGARSLAMGLNRLIDAGLDARNPRTARRELPAGLLSKAQVVLFCAGSFVLFLVVSMPIGLHHTFEDPQVGAGFKFINSFFTALVTLPTLLTTLRSSCNMPGCRR